MNDMEELILNFFTSQLGATGLSVVVPVEPEHWMHPSLPMESTSIHIPYGFRAPLPTSELKNLELSGDVIGTEADPGIVTLLCPAIIEASVADQPEDIVSNYLDAWLHHLLYHLILEGVEEDIEAKVDELMHTESTSTLNLMSRVQMHQLDRLAL